MGARENKWCRECKRVRVHIHRQKTKVLICQYCGTEKQETDTTEADKDIAQLQRDDVTVIYLHGRMQVRKRPKGNSK